MTTETDYRPRLNHVAITVDPALLDEAGRRTFLGFFGDVFGWSEGDNTGEKGNPLILYTGSPLQFIYLLPGEPHLVAPHLDHFGLEVASRDGLEDIVARARTYKEGDDRVQIIDVAERITRGPNHDYVLTSAYIGFLLPLMIELQHIARTDRFGR